MRWLVIDIKVRRPPLWGAPRLGICIPSAFQQAAAAQPSAVKLFTGPTEEVDYHGQPVNVGFRSPSEEPSIFKPVSRVAKIRKTAPNASRKTPGNQPRNHENDYSEKLVVVVVLSIRTLSCRSPKRPNFDSRIRTKNDLGTSPNSF